MRSNSVLVGSLCSLAQLEISDVSKVYVDWLNNGLVNQYLEVRHSKVTIESQKRFVESVLNSSNGVLFKIIVSEDLFIGTLKLEVNSSEGSLEVGIMIGESNWNGKGVGTECLKLVEVFANLHKISAITAGVMSSNSASRHLFMKSGFEEIGVLPYLFQAPSLNEHTVRFIKRLN